MFLPINLYKYLLKTKIIGIKRIKHIITIANDQKREILKSSTGIFVTFAKTPIKARLMGSDRPTKIRVLIPKY